MAERYRRYSFRLPHLESWSGLPLDRWSGAIDSPPSTYTQQGKQVDVYIWGRDLIHHGSVGHVMITEAGSPKVILSQFPHEYGGSSSHRGANRTLNFANTFRDEKRPADRCFRVYVPRAATFDTFTRDHRNRAEWDWWPSNAKQTQCARSAYDSLRMAGVPLTHYDTGEITPGELGDLLQALVGSPYVVSEKVNQR